MKTQKEKKLSSKEIYDYALEIIPDLEEQKKDKIEEANKYYDELATRLERKQFDIAKQYYITQKYQAAIMAFDIFIEDLDEAKKIWNQCQKVATSVSGVGSRYLDIISGNPEITAASSETWIPQMINYIQINGKRLAHYEI